VGCKALRGAVNEVNLDIRYQSLHWKKLRLNVNALPPTQLAGGAGEQLPL